MNALEQQQGIEDIALQTHPKTNPACITSTYITETDLVKQKTETKDLKALSLERTRILEQFRTLLQKRSAAF